MILAIERSVLVVATMAINDKVVSTPRNADHSKNCFVAEESKFKLESVESKNGILLHCSQQEANANLGTSSKNVINQDFLLETNDIRFKFRPA